jgi:acid phosphatase type 7
VIGAVTGLIALALLAAHSLVGPDDISHLAREVPPGTQVVLAAGDIADCPPAAAARVANIFDVEPGTILTLGDHAYPSGREEDFEECYEPTWGRHRDRTRPSPGNHDYRRGRSEPYFAYFGAAAGAPHKGYYSFELGEYWHAIALNTNCDHVPGGCDAGSPQDRWLRRTLAANRDRNILAFWHHARFSSGEHGDSLRARSFFEALYDAGADVVLVSHDHHYERFAPLDPAGELDADRGLRQFVVGTGGGALGRLMPEPREHTEVRDNESHGVLRLELHQDSYRWEFLAAPGSDFTDEGHAPVVGDVPGGGEEAEGGS